MKITVAQLKQLIREQIEEGASPYGHNDPEWDARVNRERNAAREAEQDQANSARWAREAEDSDARQRSVDRAKFQAGEEARRARNAEASRATERQRDFQWAAESVLRFINDHETGKDGKNKAKLPKYIKDTLNSHDVETREDKKAVENILKAMKTQSGKNAYEVYNKVTQPGWKPGLLGFGGKFFGLEEEIQQTAKIGISQTTEQDDADEAAAMPIAKKLLPILGDEKIVNDIASNGKKSGFLKFVIGNKRWYNPEMNAGQGAFDDGLISAAWKLGKIQNGPLKGKDFGSILKAIESNELGNEMPGMLSKGIGAVKGFFGMKEVRQLVREEVARQLRNKR